MRRARSYTRCGLLEGLALLGHLLPPPAQAEAPASEPGAGLPPALPHDALRATLLDVPLAVRPADERLQDASLALARTTSSLTAAADRLRGASTQLRGSVDSLAQNWQTWLDWADRGRVEARGAQVNAHLRDAAGLMRAAKEVVAFFGFEEAADGFRRSSYAGLDDRNEMVLPPRRKGRRRLALRLRPSKDADELVYMPARPTDVDLLADARQEVLDEELFVHVSRELGDSLVSSDDDALHLPLPAGGELVLAMTPIADLPGAAQADPLAVLASSYLRLRMIALYRHRRFVPHPHAAALADEPKAAPEVAGPTLRLLTLHLRSLRVLALFRRVAALLPDGDASVALQPAAFDLDASAVEGSHGAVVSLRLAHDSGIHARLAADATAVSLDLPDGRRASPASEASLPAALAHEVRRAYALELASRLGDGWAADASRGSCSATDGRTVSLAYDDERGLEAAHKAKRWPRDAPIGQTLYDWAASLP
jgi:hypothetical protein